MLDISLEGMAKEAGLPLSVVRRYWDEAKEGYLWGTRKTEDELTSKDWQYIMEIVKKRVYETRKKYYEPKAEASNSFKEKLRNLLLE